MAHEGVEMFMATYTSARTMMTGLYYLHKNPEMLQAVREEIKQAYPNPTDEMSFRNLQNLPHLVSFLQQLFQVSRLH